MKCTIIETQTQKRRPLKAVFGLSGTPDIVYQLFHTSIISSRSLDTIADDDFKRFTFFVLRFIAIAFPSVLRVNGYYLFQMIGWRWRDDCEWGDILVKVTCSVVVVVGVPCTSDSLAILYQTFAQVVYSRGWWWMDKNDENKDAVRSTFRGFGKEFFVCCYELLFR